MDHDGAREPIGLADADLVLRSRSGDRSAFGELWRRHYRAGVTVARNLTSSLDADDLVQEAYTRIYQSILTGRGPTGSFRAYLFTSIRNTAASWGRAQRDAAYDALEGVEDPAAQEHASEAALDRGLTHQAFRSLPTRWQEVLWYSEIEQMKPAEIAPLLGMKPTAVAQLTFRAREGLREAWIQAHLRNVADGSDCQWTIERLGAHARRNLGRRDQGKVDRHLAECVRCSIVASEAKEVSSRLALVLLPLALGATGAAGYLATLQGGSAPLVALAAMPSGVVQGAVAAIPTVTNGAGAGGVGAAATGAATTGSGVVGAGAGAASGAGGASVGASAAGGSAATASASAAGTVGVSAATASVTAAGVSGSALAGIGASSGIAASLVVVGGVVVGGVVAAAVVLPTTAPDRMEPEPTSVSNTVPVSPGLLSSEDDPAGLVDGGPGPADIPVVPDPIENANGGTADSPPADGSATAGGTTGGGQTADETPARGRNGTPSTPGSGSGGTPSTPGNGTPTKGTGSGNGGVTGNDGATGNGSPTNGTGNGNRGVPGNGNAVPGAGNGDHGKGNGKGNGKGATDQENVPAGLGPIDLPTPLAAPATAGAAASDPADAPAPSEADADGESPAPHSA